MLRKKMRRGKTRHKILLKTSATIGEKEEANEKNRRVRRHFWTFAICREKKLSDSIRYGEWLISGVKCH